MLIIYNKTTGQVVSNQGTNSLFPLGVENIQNILNHVVDQHGGSASVYGVLRLHDIEDVEIVNKTFTHEYTVQNGEIVFGELKPIPEPKPQPPTEIEILQQENAMLQMSMMEMTMYVESQDERLQTQENAVMELSMIVAGGGL